MLRTDSILQRLWSSTMAGVTSATLLLGPALAWPAQAQEGDGFSFDIVEEGVKDTDTARVDKAKDLLSQERFGEALAELEGILADKGQKRFHAQSEYDIAKTLYRMGAFHASLNRYQLILDAGPKHEYYSQARNWLFFISRKMKDELAALQMVSTYAKAEDIPPEQQNELSYALARFYFLLALNQGAKGVEVEQSEDPPPEEPRAEEPEPDSLDLGGDDLKDDKKDPKDDGGLDFSADDLGGGDDDGFGFDFSGGDEKKPKAKPKAKPKPKPKPKDPKEGTTTEPEAKPEPKKQAAPAKSKAHKAENPKSAEESLEASLKAVSRVDEKYPLYAQALYLKGLVHFAKGDFDPAVKAFRGVVRMTNPRAAGQDSQSIGDKAQEYTKLREMAFFSLARIHYQFEQFRYAIFYYDRISRDSEQWLEAVFESSWAHFRLGEYEKGLGNLVTLQSPFFLDEYYPESSILKAITFYENCRYPEARAFLGEFKQNYGGVLAELDTLVGVSTAVAKAEGATGAEVKEGASSSKTAEQLFEELTALEKKVAEGKDDSARSIALTARLLRLALSDKRVAGFRAAIAEVDEEKAQIMALEAPFTGGAIHTELVKSLDSRRAELVNSAGNLLRDKLEAERSFLKELSSKLVRIQFEIAKMEKETIEATITNQNQTVEIEKYGYTTATDDERLYWPFEGEYWRDELGTYQYTLTKGCRPPAETTITGD
ncbi:MAG: tetratricopeptide repeat protein [Deltaproteobacteria bacterium]|nr:tetratricopeptide repeat protein [Deltaproteobacteria bacterium]